MKYRILLITTVCLTFVAALPAHAQVARRVDEGSSAYQGLVRKNLDLRKELSDLEKKYADLENERRILILHVKDLQTTRDVTASEIQDLKSKISSLRIEMLKDPKMVKTLDSLNQKIIATTQERDSLQGRVDVLESEKTRLLNELKVVRDLYKQQRETFAKEKERAAQTDGQEGISSRQLSEELEKARVEFRENERKLQERLAAVEKEKESLEKKNERLQSDMEDVKDALKKAEEQIRNQAQKISARKDGDLEKAQEQLRKEEDRLKAALAEIEEKNKGLDAESQKTRKELMEAERRAEELKKEKAALQEDLKGAEASLVEAREDGERKGREILSLRAKDMEKTRTDLLRGEERLKNELDAVQAKSLAMEKENRELQEKLKAVESLLDAANTALRMEKASNAAMKGRAALKKAEEKFKKEIKAIGAENAKLAKDLDGARALLAETKKDLGNRLRDAGAENARLKKEFRQEQGLLKASLEEMNRQTARLTDDLKKAQKEKEKIRKDLADVEGGLKTIEEKNQELIRENKDMDALVKKSVQDLQRQAKEAEYDRQHLLDKLKNTAMDKSMIEVKIEMLEDRALAAEAKLAGIENDLKTETARASLQESQIMALREEKSKLEQKLIKYIERIIRVESRPGIKGMKPEKRESDAYGDLVELPKARSRREIDQQKLDMHYNLAIAYGRRGMYEAERREYLKCLRINPKDANVHYNLGILYDDKLNMNERAIEHYKKFIELRPIGEDADLVKTWILYAEQELRLGPQTR